MAIEYYKAQNIKISLKKDIFEILGYAKRKRYKKKFKSKSTLINAEDVDHDLQSRISIL
jgi:hypothetical protein